MSSRTPGAITAAVLLILLAGVQAQRSVTLSSQSLCAVTESTVKISCRFTPPDSSREREWYQLQSSGEERVLSKDPQYSRRVSVSTEQNNCELTIWDVSVRDSGVYNFRFKTWSSDWISASSGVNLTVTELQVKVGRKAAGQRKLNMACSSTCRPSERLYYIWYRNGEYKTSGDNSTILLDTTDPSYEGSYSCRMSGSFFQAPPLCVSTSLDKASCWSVTYIPTAICAVIGSSVNMASYYTFPDNHNVSKSVWFIRKQAGAEPVDVREDEEYQGRVQYRQSFQNDCSMRITHLRETDAQTYRFRFYTDGGEYTGQAGLTVSVTDLKVTVSDTEGGGKTLNCSSTCALPTYTAYTWFKNGEPVSDQHGNNTGQYLSVSVVGADNYSCMVQHETYRSPAVYSPRNTRAAIVSSGERVSEGDSVTLSCSSDANPPVLIYSWFKQRADAPLTTGRNYTIPSISSQHSGLYYCTAQNQLGQDDSTPVHLDVSYVGNTAVKYAAPAVIAVLLLTCVAVFLCLRRRAAASCSGSKENSGNDATAPVYEQVSDLAVTSDPKRTAASDDQDEVQYSSVHFTLSNVRGSNALNQDETVEYSTVTLSRPGAVE